MKKIFENIKAKKPELTKKKTEVPKSIDPVEPKQLVKVKLSVKDYLRIFTGWFEQNALSWLGEDVHPSDGYKYIKWIIALIVLGSIITALIK